MVNSYWVLISKYLFNQWIVNKNSSWVKSSSIINNQLEHIEYLINELVKLYNNNNNRYL
jgi:hypothetical protein